MMMFLRRKNSSFQSSIIHNISGRIIYQSSNLLQNYFSTSSENNTNNFMTDYLVTSLGFSPQKAATVSKTISYVTSSSKPDSVRHFLKHIGGFTDPEIRTIVTNCPPILCCNIQNMDRNFRYLRETKIFTDHELGNFIKRNPHALQRTSTIAHFKFWTDFFKGDMRRLKLALMRNRNLIAHSINTMVTTKIGLLREYDLSHKAITDILAKSSCLVGLGTASIKSLLKKVEDFGFARGSPMFVLATLSFCCIKSETFKAKMELYKSFGWSDKELHYALMSFPYIIRLSEENIRAKMEFLLHKAGCTLGYIARNPCMVGYSLEKRLIPRHHVMEILKSNNLLEKELAFSSVMSFSDEKFMEKFVLPYKDILPTLRETFNDACAGKKLALEA